MSGGEIPDNKCRSSTLVGLSNPVIAPHALFSFGSSMSACEDFVHTGSAYSAIE